MTSTVLAQIPMDIRRYDADKRFAFVQSWPLGMTYNINIARQREICVALPLQVRFLPLLMKGKPTVVSLSGVASSVSNLFPRTHGKLCRGVFHVLRHRHCTGMSKTNTIEQLQRYLRSSVSTKHHPVNSLFCTVPTDNFCTHNAHALSYCRSPPLRCWPRVGR